MKILLIGCGKMGKSILQGWLKYNILKLQNIYVVAPNNYLNLKKEFDIQTFSSMSEALNKTKYDLIIFAIKPQIFRNVIIEFKNYSNKNTIFISILAGTSIAKFKEYLPNNNIIRVMPNLPSVIGEGVFGCYSEDADIDTKNIDMLFSKIGKVFWFDKEDQIDAITAISGSGPAYVFHFIDCLNKLAQEINIPKNVSLDIIMQTVIGSVNLLKEQKISPEILRKNVTSKNGTTEAGLNHLIGEKDALQLLLDKTVKAAYNRAKELSKE